MTNTAAPTMRAIRPWIAALLTFLGWGLGLYYARRTRLALWAVAANIIIGIALAFGLFGYIFVSNSIPDWFEPGDDAWTIVDTVNVNVALTASFAVVVWVVAAQRREVERASPARLWGYLGIWLLPILISLTLAMAIRFAVVQPFRIPSGSMQPTLHVGDYILVKKWSYGYSRFSAAPLHSLLPEGRMFARQPQRGDLAVYRPTPEPDRDFVSRVVGLPGDRLQVIDGVLHINGAAVEREDLGTVQLTNDSGETDAIQVWRETLSGGVTFKTFDRTPRGELDNTRVYVVPEGHYFMMGDDRDNAADSRVPSAVGYVPFENFVGRVEHIIKSGEGRSDERN